MPRLTRERPIVDDKSTNGKVRQNDNTNRKATIESRAPKFIEPPQRLSNKQVREHEPSPRQTTPRVEATSPAESAVEESHDDEPPLYPAYCFSASRTYFRWVKLTIHDIHSKLRHDSKYQHSLATDPRHRRSPPLLLFYLNHPIQFVQIAGVVTVVDDFEWAWIITLDDSSGGTIEVKCQKPKTETREDRTEEEKRDEKEIAELSSKVEAVATIGTILQVQGVITVYNRNKPMFIANAINAIFDGKQDWSTRAQQTRMQEEQVQNIRQIQLLRVNVVRSTTQELEFIADRTRFYKEVLCTPWYLTSQDRQALHDRVIGVQDTTRARAVQRKQYESRRAQQEIDDQKEIAAAYALEELARASAANATKQHALRSASPAAKPMTSADTDDWTDVSVVIQEETLAPHSAKKRKRRKRKGHQNSEYMDEANEQASSTALESFAADRDERSALLRAVAVS